MNSEKTRLIKNAISENTRYLTGTDTYKTYKFMRDKGIIQSDKVFFKDDEGGKTISNKPMIDYKKTIIANFDNDRKTMIEYFEEHEYEKSYKYGIVKEIDIGNMELNNIIDSLCKSNYVSLENNDYDYSFRNPRLKKCNDTYCLKFSYIVGTRADKSDWFAYPIILSLDASKKILVITFDSIPYTHYIRKDFYQNIAKSIVSWAESYIGIKTKELKMLEMVKSIIELKNKNPQLFTDIKEYIRDGYDKFGGRFKLVADDNDNMSFIDQLSKIAESLSTEEDKNKLRRFISDISNNMLFIERGLTWTQYKGRKTKITMTFRDNFIPGEMLLIHFYENNWNRERIAYGIEYIINYKTKVIE